MFSPYVRIFGMEAPVVMLPELKEIMEKLILILTLINKYVIGENDINSLTYYALNNLIKIYYNKSKSGQKTKSIDLTSAELKALSVDILDFNVWEDETSIAIEKNGELVIDYPKKRKLNYSKIEQKLQDIIEDYKKIYANNKKTGKTQIEFKSYKGCVVEVPSYLTPIMQGILSSYNKIPWIYGKENIHNEFSYSCLVADNVPEEDWRNLEILMKILDYKRSNYFCEEKFLENYYFFVYKTLCKIPDQDTKYLVFYAIEKIYSLELYEFETKKIYEYINGEKDGCLNKEPEILADLLNRIFVFNGVRGKLELADEVLDSFFENIDSSRGDLYNKIDDIFQKYERNFVFVKKGEVFEKRKLEAEIKKCGEKEWEWYNNRHRKALMYGNKYKEWEKEYFLSEEMKDVMILVMQSSISYSLDFKFSFSDGDKIWGR